MWNVNNLHHYMGPLLIFIFISLSKRREEKRSISTVMISNLNFVAVADFFNFRV